MKLPAKDSYFKSVIIVVDGDVKKKRSYRDILNENKNVCALPGEESPERIIHLYLEDLVADPTHNFWVDNQDFLHTQIVRDNLLKYINDRLETANDKKIREHYKEWFREFKPKFEETNILRYWMNDNIDELTDYIFQFNNTINYIRQLHLDHDI
ncbi:hypothetical protein D3C76_1465200 [compost metagenome]